MARKRGFNSFNLSFLDIMSCGFGAVVLFFMIINHATKDHNEQVNRELISETSLLEKRVDLGKRNLVEVQNSIEESRKDRDETFGRSEIVLEELRKRREELAMLDAETLARVESINKLKADLKQIEEKVRRLQGSQAQRSDVGDDLRTVLGAGDRLYLTGLKVGGNNALFLVDSSASMLDETIVNIIRRRNMTDADKIASRKWQRVLGSVEWLIAKMPKESKFQIYSFNQIASPVVDGSGGTWLSADNPEEVDAAISGINTVVPGRGTSLYRAFEVAASLDPMPDNIYLITDGLPTMSDSLPKSGKVSGRQRVRHYNRALNVLPKNIPVNIIMLPMEGDPYAASTYWRLAAASGGSFISPARDWP